MRCRSWDWLMFRGKNFKKNWFQLEISAPTHLSITENVLINFGAFTIWIILSSRNSIVIGMAMTNSLYRQCLLATLEALYWKILKKLMRGLPHKKGINPRFRLRFTVTILYLFLHFFLYFYYFMQFSSKIV